MSAPARQLASLLAEMRPTLNPGVFAFSTLPPDADPRSIDAVAMIRESEGWTVVAEEGVIMRAGLPVLFRAAWITLAADSDLDAVGFTASFAAALTDAGISCNVIAGVHHDHVFVPAEQGQAAMVRLRSLQESQRR